MDVHIHIHIHDERERDDPEQGPTGADALVERGDVDSTERLLGFQPFMTRRDLDEGDNS